MALEVLEQTTIVVDGIEYLVTAMGAEQSLEFFADHQQEIVTGKINVKMRKQLICSCVAVDNRAITPQRFDIIFSRKFKHLRELYNEVSNWNFPDFLEEPDTEEK